MIYHLPPYPTNRLEALLHLDTLARAMVSQQDTSYRTYNIQWWIIPLWSIVHVGSMVMTVLYMMKQQHISTYTIVYDPDAIPDDTAPWRNTADKKITTSFGHQIQITSHWPVPWRMDELCCILQLYETVTSIKLYTINEREQITSAHPILRIGANLHQWLPLDTSLTEDEQILTKLALGQLDDTSIVGYNLLQTMIHYYAIQKPSYTLIPISYHNTALVDGQKENTVSYCAAIII